LAWAGYEDVAAVIREGWAAKDRAKTTSALDDQLVDDIAIIGTQEECQDRIRAYGEAGITTHIISCVSGKHAQATYNAFTGNQFSV